MTKIEYLHFNQVDPDNFLPVLNDPTLRKHLIAHGIFDSGSIKEWMNSKILSESIPGCRVRAVAIDGLLAGWCGLQPDDNGVEIAIVISQQFWGFGLSIFKTLMGWAEELGHKEILFHLLDSRPTYRFLARQATKVQKTELLGRKFTTYYLPVADWNKRNSDAEVLPIYPL